MRPIRVVAGPIAAASANSVVLSQTPVSGTALTINGSLATSGVATFLVPQRVLLTYGNEGSARTLVLTGTNWSGQTIAETLAVPSGAGGTVASVLDYATLTSALPLGGGWTAAVTLGTNGIASSAWVRFDGWGAPQVVFQCVASGTVNYTVQVTQDDPNSPTDPVAMSAMTWSSAPDPNVVAATTTQMSSFGFCPAFARVTVNSGTGSVATTFTQLDGVRL